MVLELAYDGLSTLEKLRNIIFQTVLHDSVQPHGNGSLIFYGHKSMTTQGSLSALKRWKSHGARSGECDGCPNTFPFHSASSWTTETARWIQLCHEEKWANFQNLWLNFCSFWPNLVNGTHQDRFSFCKTSHAFLVKTTTSRLISAASLLS